MFPAGALSAAAACFVAAALFHRHRDRVLAARARRFRGPPGPRRRYLAGRAAQVDMVLPVLACAVLGLALLAVGLAASLF